MEITEVDEGNNNNNKKWLEKKMNWRMQSIVPLDVML